MTLTILEGQGSLIFQEEVVTLEPELFVFIPAQRPYTLQTQTDLLLLLSRYQPDPVADESAWIVNL